MFWPLWIANALLQWGLFALILRKKGWRGHPAFAVYIAFCSVKTTLLMGITLFARPLYFPVNWGIRLVGLPLMVAVFVEVFAAVFRPYSTLPKGTLRWFQIVFGSLILVAIAIAFLPPIPVPRDLTNTVLVLNRSVSIVFCGAFGFTALFSSYFGIPWQTRTYGIGVGFLVFLSVDLFVSSLSAAHGLAAIHSLDFVTMVSYSAALITWIYHFARPAIQTHLPSLEELQQLRRALDYPARKAESLRQTF